VKKYLRHPAVLLVALLAAVGIYAAVANSDEPPRKISLVEFRDALDDGEVAKVEMLDRSSKLKGEFDSGEEFRVTYPLQYGDEMTDLILDSDNPPELKVNSQAEPFWKTLLLNFLPFLLLIGVFLFAMNSMQGGGKVTQFGKARPRRVNKDMPQVTFADVAGADEAVEELREIEQFLENPAKFQSLGAKIPKGVLLFGPPGTGKTLLARAVAGEAGVPFFSISGSDFVEMFVGVGASRVRDLFEQAKTAAPAIIFVDEIDAVGRQRGAGLGGGHDEREQTLNQLLVEMDGFDAKTGVIMIAATNRPDILDPALLRPGRFDRQIVVDAPDIAGRRQILKVHAKDKPLADGVDLDVIARRTPGFTGADLANLMNEAALLTARNGLTQIGTMQLESAIDRVIGGPERKTRVMSESERKVIAFHESGHALVGHLLPHADPVHKVSIIPRGQALGWTLQLPEEDRHITTRSALCDRLAVLLGGRTAEELIYGDPSTGASNDIERATEIARAMVTQYGMSDSLGPLQLGQRSAEVFLGRDLSTQPNYSESVASRIDEEIRRLMDEAHERAHGILTTHRAVLDRMAELLMEKETLEPDEVRALLDPLPKWTSAAAFSSRGTR
jgi:cell division protease FtsH